MWRGGLRAGASLILPRWAPGVGGLVFNGHLHRGRPGPLGEIGTLWWTPGQCCGCGASGCLETYLGAVGLSRRSGAPLRGAGTQNIDVSPSNWPRRARRGDSIAHGFGSGRERPWARPNLVNVLNPDEVMFTGAARRRPFLPEARRVLRSTAFPGAGLGGPFSREPPSGRPGSAGAALLVE